VRSKWPLIVLGMMLVAVLAVVAISAVTSQQINANNSQNNNSVVLINNKYINVEIATSSQKQQSGLCCRDWLEKDSGMLFVYEYSAVRKFWMKNTRIPLDMYWIDSDKKIIHIENNVQPESYPKTYGPNQPSMYVLETNANFAKENSIEIGHRAIFSL